MAKKRLVDTKFWEDNYSSNLDPIEKLMFLYFLTNSHTNICGIYQVPLKIIAVDTGIDRDMVLKILSRFEGDGKLIFRDGWIAIKNFIRYQNEGSPKIKAGIDKELLGVPKELKDWALGSQEQEKNEESRKGIDTLSHSNRDSNSNSNSNSNRDYNITSNEVIETVVSNHTENFNRTPETLEAEIITEVQDLEVSDVPPAVVARGDPGINEIIQAIKDYHKVIDGTNEENRRYGNHLKKKLLEINGFDGRFYDFIKTLCEKSSKYEKRNTTSCKSIYYNLGKIISSIREETNSGPC